MIVDGIEWYQRNRAQLIREHGADFVAAIHGATGDCIVRPSTKEARRVYNILHPKEPPVLIIMGAAL